MKKTALILALVLVVGIVFAFHGEGREEGKAEGQGHDGMRGEMHGEMMMGRMMETLELTDAQKDKIETLNFEHKKQMIATRAELKTLELEKREALKDDNFAAAKKLNIKIFDKKAEIANARLELKENIMKELTPEQQEKAKELHKRAGRKMMKEHRGAKDGAKEGHKNVEKGEGRRGMHGQNNDCDDCQTEE